MFTKITSPKQLEPFRGRIIVIQGQYIGRFKHHELTDVTYALLDEVFFVAYPQVIHITANNSHFKSYEIDDDLPSNGFVFHIPKQTAQLIAHLKQYGLSMDLEKLLITTQKQRLYLFLQAEEKGDISRSALEPSEARPIYIRLATPQELETLTEQLRFKTTHVEHYSDDNILDITASQQHENNCVLHGPTYTPMMAAISELFYSTIESELELVQFENSIVAIKYQFPGYFRDQGLKNMSYAIVEEVQGKIQFNVFLSPNNRTIGAQMVTFPVDVRPALPNEVRVLIDAVKDRECFIQSNEPLMHVKSVFKDLVLNIEYEASAAARNK